MFIPSINRSSKQISQCKQNEFWDSEQRRQFVFTRNRFRHMHDTRLNFFFCMVIVLNEKNDDVNACESDREAMKKVASCVRIAENVFVCKKKSLPNKQKKNNFVKIHNMIRFCF